MELYVPMFAYSVALIYAPITTITATAIASSIALKAPYYAVKSLRLNQKRCPR